jgi:hypothetical protein
MRRRDGLGQMRYSMPAQVGRESARCSVCGIGTRIHGLVGVVPHAGRGAWPDS